MAWLSPDLFEAGREGVYVLRKDNEVLGANAFETDLTCADVSDTHAELLTATSRSWADAAWLLWRGPKEMMQFDKLIDLQQAHGVGDEIVLEAR